METVSNHSYQGGALRSEIKTAAIVCILSVIALCHILREYSEMNLEVILPKNERYTGCFIFLHGAIRSGKWQKDRFEELLLDKSQIADVKIIFPTAPIKYFDLMDRATNIWFNLKKSDVEGQPPVTDLSEIDEAVDLLKNVIEKEVKNGIPINRIAIGGISQGGMVALHAVYRAVPEVAGCIAVSSMIPHEEEVVKAIVNRGNNPPVYLLNGMLDDKFPIRLVKEMFERMKKVDPQINTILFPSAGHELIEEEIIRLYGIIRNILPSNI